MFIVDESALNFEIPARDSLGREAVIGKLSGTQEEVLFTWRLKDRTFRKAEGDMKTVRIPYRQVESVTFKATFGFINPRLILLVADPHLIEEVPGTDVGKATLMLEKRSKAAAQKFLKLVDFKKSEADANQARSRLLDIPEPGKLD
jgi:hypothetical protein